MSRRLPVLLSTVLTGALAAAALTACSAAPAEACQAAAPGDASNSVRVTGDLGGTLAVDATFPLSASTTQRSVLLEGTGAVLDDGLTGELSYALYNATTGELLERSQDVSEAPVPFPYQSGTSAPGLESALRCAAAGSRIVAVIPPADSGAADYDLLFVADVLRVEPTPPAPSPTPPALPTPSAWTADVPAVDLGAMPPTVTIPDAPPPADLVVAVLEQGDGPVVPSTASVTVDYLGTSWDTKQVFDSSYANGQPAAFSLSRVIPGFAAAIAGQQVGSTVLVSIPPELAYGAAANSSNALAGQTLVFLIVIEAAQ